MVKQLLDIFNDTESIIQFLRQKRAQGETIGDFCDRLGESHGTDSFAEVLFFLTHMSFEPDAARGHWAEILRHRERLAGQTGRAVGLPTAVLDYFTSAAPHFETPVSLEADALARCARLSMLDELTGLFNRRFFNSEIEREMERSRRLERPMSLFMVDIDHFKTFNDTYGHPSGDRVLAAVARILRDKARLTDQPARYGGEEFTVILPHTTKDDALVLAERYRQAVEAMDVTDSHGAPVPAVTISLGVAQYPEDADDAPSMIEAADRALYRAKNRGRNMVCTENEELRSARRVSVNLDAQCMPRGGPGSPISARTLNLSLAGARCETTRQIEPGTMIDLVLHDPRRGLALPLPARTIWTRESADRGFTNGLSFEQAPSRALFQLERYFDELAGAI